MPSAKRLIFLLLATGPVGAAVPEVIDFNSHVKPILSDRCFLCHGPDERNRKAKLRLDRREDALRAAPEAGPDWQVIRPGDPDRSTLMARIASTDPDEVMPPPESHLSITADEREILRRWIADGAPWRDHWSFLPVTPPAVPPVPADGNEIDGYVARSLAATGRALRPAAPKERLLRRAALVLTGLPPDADALAAFMADTGPDAFPRAVDRLLANPAYGERMATDWCDIARYADTYGYQNDRHRDVWPWRDWVIRAFNDNLPYDRFITWQLAGDLLPNPTRDQLVATAFNRLHRQTNEGGSVEEEFRVEYVNDRVTTYGTAFLGLTLECSRCHDHKYDPVSMRDFYSLFAFFQNIDESGLYAHFTDDTPTPALPLTTPEQETRLASLTKEAASAEAALAGLRQRRRPAFEAWARDVPAALPLPDELAHLKFDDLKTNAAAGGSPAHPFENPQLVEGREGKALGLDGENGVKLDAGGRFTREQPFSVALWLRTPDVKDRAVVFHRSAAWTDAASRGYQLLIEDGRLSAALVHFWPGDAVCVRTVEPVTPGQWTHVVMTSDGSGRASGLRLHVNGRPAVCEVARDRLTRNIHGGEATQVTIGQRFRDRGFKGGAVDEFRLFSRAITPPEIAQLARAAPVRDGEALFDYWLSAHDAEWRAAVARVQQARTAQHAVSDGVPALMVMAELPQPKPAYLLMRGAYDARGEKVEAGTPASILPFDASWPRHRLGLARWTTDPRQPLTARVVVNRLWAQVFGRGIVHTLDDFGNQGSLPSHPELLDWLAHRFMSTGWDVKAMLRFMVLSRTWQQESGGDAAAFRDDPENIALARGPRFRLPAEAIRDSALAVSGLLVRRVGGPGVKPYQPPGIWEEKGGGWSYQPDAGEGLWRRSLYTYWKRTAPPPAMETFDAAKREVCVARRQVTSTPLQALVLMNDEQYLEAARVAGEQLVAAHGADAAALCRAAFQQVLGREPSAVEAAALERLFAAQSAHYTGRPEAAAALLKIGRRPPAAGLDPVRTAAAMLVVSTLFNHDEFSTLR